MLGHRGTGVPGDGVGSASVVVVSDDAVGSMAQQQWSTAVVSQWYGMRRRSGLDEVVESRSESRDKIVQLPLKQPMVVGLRLVECSTPVWPGAVVAYVRVVGSY